MGMLACAILAVLARSRLSLALSRGVPCTRARPRGAIGDARRNAFGGCHPRRHTMNA